MVIPFSLGILCTALACLQQNHNVRGLWRRSFLTSLAIGACQFLMVRWAISPGVEFWYFQGGAAIGSALGCSIAARSFRSRSVSGGRS